MSQDRLDESWRATLDLEAGRRYRFRTRAAPTPRGPLLDGNTWLTDRQADDCAANATGSYDSVVDLTEFDGPLSA
jgi:hypothetical protein